MKRAARARFERARLRRRGGFTLLEALAVLAIAGITLSLVFSVAARTQAAGFRVGARALSVADIQAGQASFRAVIQGVIPPPVTAQAASQVQLDPSQDDTFSGAADNLSALFTARRATVCAPAGRSGRLSLKIVQVQGRDMLNCEVDADPAATIDMGVRGLRFSYSDDGVTWSDSWTVEHGQPVTASANPTAQLRKVYVRLLSSSPGPGAPAQVVARAASDRPAGPIAGRPIL